jgi:hypothetical protein
MITMHPLNDEARETPYVMMCVCVCACVCVCVSVCVCVCARARVIDRALNSVPIAQQHCQFLIRNWV